MVINKILVKSKKLFVALTISACAIAPTLSISNYTDSNIQSAQPKSLQKPLDTSWIFNYNRVVYAGTLGQELYESPDNGKTWTIVATLAKIETYNLRVYNNVIYVETKCNSLYESRDNKKTFVQRFAS